MARRGADLFALVGDDPRFAWYGRNVTLADVHASGLDTFEALIRLQGATAGYFVRRDAEAGIRRELEARGLRTDAMGFALSPGDRSVELAKNIVESISRPADLDVVTIGPRSPEADLEAFADLSLAQGVLPPPDAVLRGSARRGVALVARERGTGRAVGCAASFANFHPASPMAGMCFWGMLATHPDRRGEGIALVLGARAMLEMRDRTGIGRFSTGIRDDNLPSLRLCSKLGVEKSDYMIVLGMDPDAFADARVTK